MTESLLVIIQDLKCSPLPLLCGRPWTWFYQRMVQTFQLVLGYLKICDVTCTSVYNMAKGEEKCCNLASFYIMMDLLWGNMLTKKLM